MSDLEGPKHTESELMKLKRRKCECALSDDEKKGENQRGKRHKRNRLMSGADTRAKEQIISGSLPRTQTVSEISGARMHRVQS